MKFRGSENIRKFFTLSESPKIMEGRSLSLLKYDFMP
jgi:hypothetical protein